MHYYAWLWENNLTVTTRKYKHAETPRLADKTIVFSEYEVFRVVVVVTQ